VNREVFDVERSEITLAKGAGEAEREHQAIAAGALPGAERMHDARDIRSAALTLKRGYRCPSNSIQRSTCRSQGATSFTRASHVRICMIVARVRELTMPSRWSVHTV
jgi:hypothetical protein